MRSLDVRASYFEISASDWLVALFGFTVALSAALLFAIQPMYAKMLLPLLGGAPAVWSVVVVFFQVALLAGYLFAHFLRTSVPLHVQPLVHIGLAVLALIVLPFRVGAGDADAIAHPVAFALATLFAGAGLPFLVISATSPLLQSWFARLGHKNSADPYFLYAASNAGSLFGLAIYPVLLEPLFGVTLQTRIWAIAYLVLILFFAACSAATWRLGVGTPCEKTIEVLREEPITFLRRLRWIGLAFVPASLSLAMTTRITSDVAPIPLLWTLPLGVYLLTFIIAFSQRPFLTPQRVARVLPYAILLVVLLALLGAALPAGLDIVLNLAALFLIGVTCHGELAASRPQTRHLTQFYVLLSIGGALAGIFNAIVAPNVFRTIAEYPLTIVLACAILPTLGQTARSAKEWFPDVALPVLLGIALVLLFELTHRTTQLALAMQIGFALAMIACFAFVGHRVRLAWGIAVLFLVASLLPSRLGYQPGVSRNFYPRLDAQRNFFGTKLVVENALGWHELIHGGTIHGLQDIRPKQNTIPLTYYSYDGPLKSIFDAARAQRQHGTHVGVVGLGIGSIACYRRPGEAWSFIEIDPQVVAIARNTALFSYLSSCAPSANVIVGDGRLELTRISPGTFDLLVLDAYSSDQPPVHMLTREAFELYARDVRQNGLIAFHISNRYFDLAPVLGNLAFEAGWKAWIDNDLALTPHRWNEGQSASQWVVMARSERDARQIASAPQWHRLKANSNLRTWTDDYSSLLLIIHKPKLTMAVWRS